MIKTYDYYDENYSCKAVKNSLLLAVPNAVTHIRAVEELNGKKDKMFQIFRARKWNEKKAANEEIKTKRSQDIVSMSWELRSSNKKLSIPQTIFIKKLWNFFNKFI